MIYRLTKPKLKHAIFQLLDIELYRTLYISYVLDINEPTNPQRYIQSLRFFFARIIAGHVSFFVLYSMEAMCYSICIFIKN